MAQKKHAALNISASSAAAPADPNARVNNLAVVGYGSALAADEILTLNGYSDLDTEVGDGSLREFCAQFWSEAAKKSQKLTLIGCSSGAAAAIAGSNGSVTHTGEGVGDMTLSGTARFACEPIVKVTTTGALGTGAVALSLDDGDTYGTPQVVPASGVLLLHPTLGITATFDGALLLNDTYAWDAVADDPKERGVNCEVTHTGTGAGEATITGRAKWQVQPRIKVASTGALGAATVQVSLDDGETYADAVTVPESGAVVLKANLGLTATFDDALVAADEYAWVCTPDEVAVGASDATAGSALHALAAYFATQPVAWPEAIHCELPVDPAGVALLNTLAAARLTTHKAPMLFTGLFRRPTMIAAEAETVAEYAAAIQGATEGMAHASATGKKWFGWLLGYPTLTAYDASQLPVSPAGTMLGRMANLPKISDSTGRTSVQGYGTELAAVVHDLYFTDAQIAALDEAGGTLLRRHPGVVGKTYVTRMGTLAGATNSAQCFDRQRVVLYAVGLVFNLLFPLLDVDLDGDEGGAMEPETLDARLTGALRQDMAGLCADAYTTTEEVDGTLNIQVSVVPLTKASEINANIALTETLSV